MPQMKHFRWVLVLLCLALAVLFCLAFVVDADGDLGSACCLADGASHFPDELIRTVTTSDIPGLCPALSVRLRLGAGGLLAVVPGGLCLLD